MLTKTYYIYMMSNHTNSVIYAGVTNDLCRRVYEHKNKLIKGFADQYNVTKLVYYESCQDASSAIAREKQIKGGSRKKKMELINSMNPKWSELMITEIASSPLRGSSQ